MTGVPLSVLDELYLHLDRDTEPWSVQLEAQVEGHLDPDRDGSRFVDTTVLSNLGRHEPVPALDADAGRVRRVWFSPPGRMPLGASLGCHHLRRPPLPLASLPPRAVRRVRGRRLRRLAPRPAHDDLKDP
jgi:hypothetical protein